MLEMIIEAGISIGVCLLIGIVGLITYCIFHDDGVRTWTKTIYFMVLSGAVVAVIAWLCQCADATSGIFGWIIPAVLGTLFFAGAVYGHKKNWKQDL